MTATDDLIREANAIIGSFAGLTVLLFILFIITICLKPRSTCTPSCAAAAISSSQLPKPNNSTVFSAMKHPPGGKGKLNTSTSRDSSNLALPKATIEAESMYSTIIMSSSVVKKMSSINKK